MGRCGKGAFGDFWSLNLEFLSEISRNSRIPS